jgi:hypothetical protein
MHSVFYGKSGVTSSIHFKVLVILIFLDTFLLLCDVSRKVRMTSNSERGSRRLEHIIHCAYMVYIFS